jgi:hypothetical protein
MGLGLVAGLVISYVWPHEHAAATVGDRNDKFAVVTAAIDATNFVEGIFVLDFLTGQLRGSALNPSAGAFTVLYARNVAADFNVNANRPGTYALVSGRTNLTTTGGAQLGASCIYVAELTSGKVIAYSFPVGARGGATLPMAPVDGFQFREAIQ